MKFLLCAINAKYIHSNLAVYCLKAYAGEKWKEKIEIAEYTINQYADDILADLYERKPDIIGISCYIWNWELVKALLAELPKVLPGVPVWLGGPEAAHDAPRILNQFSRLAGVMVGEGEKPFLSLLEYYEKQENLRGNPVSEKCREESVPESLREIPGLCLADGYTDCQEELCLDELPFPYADLAGFRDKILYYESSRGCPFRCSYCLSSIEKTVRQKGLRLVEKELQAFLDAGVKQVKFVDRTFNCDPGRTLTIWNYLLEHDNGVTNFHFEISADLLNEEEISLLRRMRPGLIQLEIGVQSANPQTLRAVHRRMDAEKLKTAVGKVSEGHHVHQHLDLIAGLPFEDYDSFSRSFNWVYAMRPQQLQLGFLKVLKGSEMARRKEEFGICCQEKPPYEVLYTRWLPYKDVLRLKRIEEMVELYYNSGQFTCTLPLLEKAFPSPFALFEALAKEYQEKGYFVNHPSRSYRYQVLLAFALKYGEGNGDSYREALTCDLYLRENLKSRPDFAADLEPFRQEIRRFYQRETAEGSFPKAYEGYDEKQIMRMTHLEPFRYPVWDPAAMTRETANGRTQYGWFVLFDYQNRDPITSNASVIVREREAI